MIIFYVGGNSGDENGNSCCFLRVEMSLVLVTFSSLNILYNGKICCLLQWFVPINNVRGIFYFFIAFAGSGEVGDKVPHPSHSLAGGGYQHPTVFHLLFTVSTDLEGPEHKITMICNIKCFLLFFIMKPLRWKGHKILMQFGLFGYSPRIYILYTKMGIIHQIFLYSISPS